MEGALLCLKMEKGPLSGQNLEFNPGSKIQIGRVVRGNTLAIKDPGISSKHLRIEFESGSWVITDLGSSNGTIHNTITIDPSHPVKLTDGDVIKLGELTSIKVKIDEPAEELDGKGKNTRRKPKGKVLGEIVENVELGFGIENGKRVTRSSKTVKNEAVELGFGNENGKRVTRSSKTLKNERKASPRRTRGKVESVEIGDDSMEEAESVAVVAVELGFGIKNGKRVTKSSKAVKNEADNIDEVVKERKVNLRRTRGKVESVEVGDDSVEEAESVAVVAVELGFGIENGKRVTRSSKAVKNEADNIDEVVKERKVNPRRTRGKVESVEVGDDSVEKAESVAVVKLSPRRTRSSRRAENVNTIAIDVGKEKILPRRVRGSRKKEDAENVKIGTDNVEKAKNIVAVDVDNDKKMAFSSRIRGSVMEEEAEIAVEDVNNEKKVCSEEEAVENNGDVGVKGCKGSVSNPWVNKSATQMEEVDFDKMTLRDWFDLMEVYLPLVTIEETEEIFGQMAQIAEKTEEYMLQHKNAKN